jgi:hypothetical protein
MKSRRGSGRFKRNARPSVGKSVGEAARLCWTRKGRESELKSATFDQTQESLMAADSDSRIAWHRVQVRRHRDTLKRIETSKFSVGEIAELKQKIKLSEQVIAEHERQGRRPLVTDLQSLSNVSWGNWAAYGSGQS